MAYRRANLPGGRRSRAGWGRDRFRKESKMRSPTFLMLICAASMSCAALARDYQSVRIVAPKPDATVHDNSGRLSVTLALRPPLDRKAGDRIVLLLDGKPVAHGTEVRFELAGVDRGSHRLQAQITAADGTVLVASPLVAFQMWRASRLFPGRRH